MIAVAGSGKTKTPAHRLAHLVVNGIDPHRILLLTFSRRAALDMTGRVKRITGTAMGIGQIDLPWAGTFHAVAAVFNLVAWWTAEGHAVDRACWALRLQNHDASTCNEPFAAIIRCTSDDAKVDKRTRSKWSRVLRYALAYKAHAEPLDRFIKRKGGINRCAERFSVRSRRHRLVNARL